MSAKGRFTPVFQRMIDAPEAALAALRDAENDFEEVLLSQEGNNHHAIAAIPNRDVLGFRMFDADGAPIELDQPDWVPSFADFDELSSHADPRSPDGRLLQVASRAQSLPIFGIWAPLHQTSGWNLPAAVHTAAASHLGGTVALFAGNQASPIKSAVAAFGLTASLQRVVVEVVRGGSIRLAAEKLGISYATAREAMVDTARRMHLPNTPAVVRAVIAAGFGIWPGDVDSPAQLADMLCVSERQAQIALLIANGSSREEAALVAGVGVAVVKKELQTLFAVFGLSSAVDLARLVTEAQALRLFARSIDNAPGFLDPSIEPSRFAIRPNNRGSFAWSDYGPASGKPVLIVHSNWCCRAVPRPLLQELQRCGWRPIAIDRPGFGASSLGGATDENPFWQAIADLLQVLDLAHIDAIPVIARCGAQFVHALKSAHPNRVGPVLLVSPTPQASAKGKRYGVVGAFKEAFYRSPRLVEMFFRVISAQFSIERVEHLVRSIARGSPTDEALCDDPQFIRDRFRALRPFTCGNYRGGIMEELIVSHGGWDFLPLNVDDWLVLQGAEDPHNSFEEVGEYWSAVLPGTAIEPVPHGGRFMTSSHAPLIVDRLMSLTR